MELDYKIITREIPAKGKGYLLIRQCPPGGQLELVRRGAAELLRAGASLLYAASTDPAAPLSRTAGEGFRLEFCHEMLRLERPLAGRPSPEGRLTLEPLSRERGGQWLTLHSEGFFDTPNSATYDHADLARCLERPGLCGFAAEEGIPVGVYELNSREGTPEIEGIALVKDARGKGLGRELLRLCMDRLAGLGYNACWLQVSTANGPALRLYREEGFVQTAVISRWYQILAEQDLLA